MKIVSLLVLAVVIFTEFCVADPVQNEHIVAQDVSGSWSLTGGEAGTSHVQLIAFGFLTVVSSDPWSAPTLIGTMISLGGLDQVKGQFQRQCATRCPSNTLYR